MDSQQIVEQCPGKMICIIIPVTRHMQSCRYAEHARRTKRTPIIPMRIAMRPDQRIKPFRLSRFVNYAGLHNCIVSKRCRAHIQHRFSGRVKTVQLIKSLLFRGLGNQPLRIVIQFDQLGRDTRQIVIRIGRFWATWPGKQEEKSSREKNRFHSRMFFMIFKSLI